MTGNKKNIDKIVKSALINFKAKAPVDAWSNIAPKIKSKKRVIFPIWFGWAATIAILLSVSLLLYYTQIDDSYSNADNSSLNL